MLAKKSKFNKEDFKNLKKNTVSTQSSIFGLVYTIKPEFAKSIIVIPKKVYKKSHDRNRIKRIFYNFLKKTSNPNLNLAIFIKNNISDLQFKAELGKIIGLNTLK